MTEAIMYLSHKRPSKSYSGDRGFYFHCSPSVLPMLRAASISAAKLSLAVSDSSNIAYSLRGKGTFAVLLPKAPSEKILLGDALALPFSVVTWWHNLYVASARLPANSQTCNRQAIIQIKSVIFFNKIQYQ